MTAAETIAEAITVLERRRASATEGPWSFHGGDPFGFYIQGRIERVVHRMDIADEDAELIVILHRTIDAQLAILRRHFDLAWAIGESYPVSYEDFGVLDLANAILGEVAPDA